MNNLMLFENLEMDNPDGGKKVNPFALQENLISLMNEHGTTLMKLSKATDTPTSTLQDWIMGNVKTPRLSRKLQRIADYFGISVDDLCFKERA